MLSPAEEQEDPFLLDTVGDVEAGDYVDDDDVLGRSRDAPRTNLANRVHTDEGVEVLATRSRVSADEILTDSSNQHEETLSFVDSWIRWGGADPRDGASELGGDGAVRCNDDLIALGNLGPWWKNFHGANVQTAKDKDKSNGDLTEISREEKATAEESVPSSDADNAYSPSELEFQEDESVLSSERNAYGTRSLQVQDELEKLKKEGMVTLSYGDHGIGSQNRIFRIHSNCWPAVINRLDASITSKDKQKNNKEGTPSENLAQTFRYCGVIPKKDPAKKKNPAKKKQNCNWRNPYEGIYEFCVEEWRKTLERTKSQNGKNKTAKRKRPETSSTSMSARRGRGSKRQRTTPPASKKPAQPAAAPATSFLVSPLAPAPDAASDFADRCLNLDSE